MVVVKIELCPWKTGSVTNHARNLSPYHLVARVFAACGIR